MKLLVIVLLVLSQNENVSCFAFFEFVSVKFHELANSVVSTLNGITNRVKTFFNQESREKRSQSTNQSPENKIIRTMFSDFVQKISTETAIDSSEYLNSKSDPTVLMSMPQLATLHGRKVQSHVVQTKDGYLLTLHRITANCAPINGSILTNRTILLHHGLLGSSADWILLGPEKSLPYLLSDVGYDVWMANARGNRYSRGHVSKRVDSIEFWKFSWQDIGEFDLPATIDYIRDVKNTSEHINYIGHSMGATALLVLLSTMPQYNHYLRIGILVAPLAFMTHIKGPITVLKDIAKDPSEAFLKIVGHGELMPSRKIPQWLAAKYCKGPSIYCNNPLLFLSGIPHGNTWNSSFVARLLYHIPSGGSTNTILHYAQLVKSGKFHRFSDVQSEFPLSEVSLPIALISSSDDWLATIPDVLSLYFSISNPIDHYVIRDKNVSHTDFVWGTEANNLIFNKVIEFLEKDLNVSSVKNNEVVNNVI